MKTLILFSSSEIGGAEQSLIRLYHYGKKDEFELGSLSGDGKILNNIAKTNVHKFGFNRRSFLNLIVSCYKAIKYSKKNKINILYICGFKACSIIRIYSLFFKTPKIIHAIRWNPVSNNTDDTIFRFFEKLFSFKTHAWICNSFSAKQTLTKYCGLPKDRIFPIHNGIGINNHTNIKKRKNIILTLSNFSPRKGIIEYLNVIEMVLKQNKNIKFILAGRDDMNGIVQEEIRRKKLDKFVDTPGFIDNPQKLIQKSKIMVLPSLLPEGCPTSVLEAMSWGLPIVCYDIKGLDELVIKNKTGYIIPLNNQKKMAEKINNLLTKSNIMEKLGSNGKQYVIKNFTLNEMLKKHRDVFSLFF